MKAEKILVPQEAENLEFAHVLFSPERVFNLPMMEKKISDNHLGHLLGEPVTIRQRTYVTGGSINLCEILTLDDGRRLFVKTYSGDVLEGMYAAEAAALELMAAPGVLDIPKPLAFDDDYLVLEAFTEGAPAADWQEQMGRGLALMHRATRQDEFGFETDNFLGTSRQVNTWQNSWVEFWRDQRLGYQIGLLRSQASHDDPLVIAAQRLQDHLVDILRFDGEPAVLLHGDLWSGNAAANSEGAPMIFDPASYYGHREAEFGMMRLFGGFTSRCEDAYQEVWPLREGADRRIQVYKLYHQLNHLILFGRSYYGGCLDTIYSLV